MNLADCLGLTGMNRNTYNSIDRRYRRPDGTGGLAFMNRRLTEQDGQDRYGLIHAVALGCFNDLREAGVPLGRAVTVVDETFDFIADNVEYAAEHPTHLGKPNFIRYFPNEAGNYGWSAGASTDQGLIAADGPIVAVDLNAVIQRIWDATSRWLGIKVG